MTEPALLVAFGMMLGATVGWFVSMIFRLSAVSQLPDQARLERAILEKTDAEPWDRAYGPLHVTWEYKERSEAGVNEPPSQEKPELPPSAMRPSKRGDD